MRRLSTACLLLTSIFLPSCAATGTGSGKAVQVQPYPLDYCLVTDSKLGSMGDPFSKVYDGLEIKFCCKPCVKKFEADKQRFLKVLAEKR